MITLYTATTSDIPDPQTHPSILEGLGEERKGKILRLRQKKSREQSLGAGLLLRKILLRYGRDMSEIYAGANGKPMMDGIYFNLSHTEGRVLLAVGDSEAGCDIERVKEFPLQVAKRFFCCGEQEYISSFPEGKERDRAFFRLWTVRESYMKMTGEGMSLPFDAFEVLTEEGLGILREGRMEDCYIREYVIGEYQAAVCAREQILAQAPETVCLL